MKMRRRWGPWAREWRTRTGPASTARAKSCAYVPLSYLVTHARPYRQRRVLRKARIGCRETAHDEVRAFGAGDDAAVNTAVTEAGALGTFAPSRLLPGLVAIVHHGFMFTSEATTRAIRVSVESEY